MHGRGVHGRAACVAGEITTVVNGTHLTGMHSCVQFNNDCLCVLLMLEF